MKDAGRLTAAGGSANGARGSRLVTLAPGRLGHHARRHHDRRARCIAGSGCAPAGEPRALRRCAHDAWPDAEPLGCVSPLGKSRGGTPEAEAPPSLPSPACGGGLSGGGASPHPLLCPPPQAGEDEGGGAEETTLRLTAFRCPFFFLTLPLVGGDYPRLDLWARFPLGSTRRVASQYALPDLSR